MVSSAPKLSPDLAEKLQTLAAEVIAYNLGPGDLAHDLWWAAKCELQQERPDSRYIEALLKTPR